MAVGICKSVIPVDAQGTTSGKALTPQDEKAVELYFEVDTTITDPPEEQLDLKRDIERALLVVKRLFIRDGKPEPKFRFYYVQLVGLAQLGLVGANASPQIARHALTSMIGGLIDSEGAGVKNAHLARLAKTGAGLAVPFVLIYCLLRLAPACPWVGPILDKLSLEPGQLSSFMILWVGCFLGVVLSYGIRTTTMTLEDLIVTDSDFLLPLTRHLFAGALTMILGIALALGIVEVKIAGISSTQLIFDPQIAFLIGALCGISELLLPATVAKRAGAVLGLN
jgi:hypothetical protein